MGWLANEQDRDDREDTWDRCAEEHSAEVHPEEQETRRDERADDRPRMIHRTMEPEGPTDLSWRRGTCDACRGCRFDARQSLKNRIEKGH